MIFKNIYLKNEVLCVKRRIFVKHHRILMEVKCATQRMEGMHSLRLKIDGVFLLLEHLYLIC